MTGKILIVQNVSIDPHFKVDKLSLPNNYCFVCLYLHHYPGFLTLCGASLYIVYSYQALDETERLVGPEVLAYIHTSFGWSLGLAWLSYGLEVITGALMLTAARMVKLQQRGPTMA